MKVIKGNIWDYHKKGKWIVIPTNGTVNRNGEAVMGRGLALQAVKKYPKLAVELGRMLKVESNGVSVFPKYKLFTFPVKRDWREKASLKRIKKSCKNIIMMINEIYVGIPGNISLIEGNIYMPKVGCGNGKLNWEDVEPVLDKYLDERFIVVEL